MPLQDQAKAMGAPPMWMCYITVEDVDESAAWVNEHGGQVLAPPFDIPGAGRCSVIMGPQGAVFGLYKAAEASEVSYDNPIPAGRISWNELMVDDLDAAKRWYGELFGWEERDTMDMGPGGTYSMYGFKDAPYAFGGMMKKPAPDMPAMWLHYIKVGDFDAAFSAVKANGGQVVNGPINTPDGQRIAQCCDPQGAMFAINGA